MGNRHCGLVLAALACLGGCDSPETSTSFSSLAFQHFRAGTSDTPLTPYRGARLFSEDNRSYRLRALGCEFDIQYALGSSESERAAANVIDEARMSLNPARFAFQFGGRLANGRMAAGDAPGTAMPCDTNTDMLVFIVGRMPMGNGSLPVAAVASQRLNETWLFAMKADYRTPAQEQKARETASGFALDLLKAWATK